ncbi:MAG TPA: 4-hydroxy-tetrahydrodipicolinate synthase [Actinomycetota bacterium]|nr:4-hydroxy-tetrahydrodipicolinate synthase [Actinomycetota bacterium]
MTARFGQVITAMVSPFAVDGSLDVKAARSLAVHLLDNGSEGLVVCGSTGESPTLSHAEKLDLFSNIVEEVGDRATVIAGTGTYDTRETIELTKEAAERGADACLVVTPYYSRPPQNALLAHFAAVADASPVPLIIYDIPARTGRRVEIPTMVELAAHESIVAVKDAVGDAVETARLRARLDEAGHTDFEIYSGDDVLLLPHIAAGAIGVISVCSHLVGSRIKEVFTRWDAGDTAGAQTAYLELIPLFSTLMTLTSNPIPLKAALGMLGIDAGEPRLPLVPATSDEATTIRTALEAAGLLS